MLSNISIKFVSPYSTYALKQLATSTINQRETLANNFSHLKTTGDRGKLLTFLKTWGRHSAKYSPNMG